LRSHFYPQAPQALKDVFEDFGIDSPCYKDRDIVHGISIANMLPKSKFVMVYPLTPVLYFDEYASTVAR
jgi:hypothetical protein